MVPIFRPLSLVGIAGKLEVFVVRGRSLEISIENRNAQSKRIMKTPVCKDGYLVFSPFTFLSSNRLI